MGNGGLDVLFGGGGNDYLAIRNGQAHGGEGDDTLKGGGELHGGAGNDRLDARFSLSPTNTVFGDEGDDILVGGEGNTTLDGGSGADRVFVSRGNLAYGGDGNDTIDGSTNDYFSPIADYLVGDAGDDSLSGNDGNDTLIGGQGSDFLLGSTGDDYLYAGGLGVGGGAQDTLVGGEGADTLVGSEGDDLLYGDNVLPLGFIPAGVTNLVQGFAGNDTLIGGVGSDVLEGGAGDDLLYAVGGGTSSFNVLIGGEGSDTMVGAGLFYRTQFVAGDGDVIKRNGNNEALEFDDEVFLVTNASPTMAAIENDGINTYVYMFDSTAATPIATLKIEGNYAPGSLQAGITTLYPGLYLKRNPDYRFETREQHHLMDSSTWLAQYRADLATRFGTDIEPGLKKIRDKAVATMSKATLDALGDKAGTEIEKLLLNAIPGLYKSVTKGLAVAALVGIAKDYVAGRYDGDPQQLAADLLGAAVSLLPVGLAGSVGLAVGQNLFNRMAYAALDGLGVVLATLRVDPTPVVTGLETPEIVIVRPGNTTLNLNGGDDTAIDAGNNSNQTYRGGTGFDRVSYGDSAAAVSVDLLQRKALGAGIGTDFLTGIEAVTGGNAGDVLLGDAVANGFQGGGGADRLEGRGGEDTLSGELGNDTLLGGDGNDLLLGGAEADMLFGDAGVDTLSGGTGSDLYYVDSELDVVLEAELALPGDVDEVRASSTYALGAGVENLRLLGTGAFQATGNDLANALTGNAADNLLDGAAGADTLSGGLGNDVYRVDSAADVVIESSSAAGGNDEVRASLSWTLGNFLENLTLTGGAVQGTGNALANRLSGNALANLLVGNAGADTLEGGAGADTLNGGLGDDVYLVDDALDLIVESSNALLGGIDEVRSAGSLTLGKYLENLTLTGAGALNGTGNTLDNVLRGGAGANTLVGGVGNDTLDGGLGKDVLSGGAGADVFAFGIVPGALDADRIADFQSGVDRIALSAGAFAALGGAVTSANFRTGGIVATTAAHRLMYQQATGRLYYDADGTGASAAVLVAVLSPVAGSTPGLQASDFVVSG